MSATPIRCSECHAETGAWFVAGDPYLPEIVCSECAEAECVEAISRIGVVRTVAA